MLPSGEEYRLLPATHPPRIMQLLKAVWALAGAAVCCVLLFVIHSHFLKEGQLAAGTCEIVTLDKDSSQPRRTIARQTARCACKKGQIAGTTRAKPACVDARIVKTRQWCEMLPCLEGEGCNLLMNKSGWTCTQPGGRIKTTTTAMQSDRHPMQHHSSSMDGRVQESRADIQQRYMRRSPDKCIKKESL